MHLRNEAVTIQVCNRPDALWRLILPGRRGGWDFAAPVFEVDGHPCPAVPARLRRRGPPRTLPHGVVEHELTGPLAADPTLQLTLLFRLAPGCPVVRCQYRLQATAPHILTRRDDCDRLDYLAFAAGPGARCTELRLSEFDESVHSFRPTEIPVSDGAFAQGLACMGPLFVVEEDGRALLVAYEHGSQVPDAFLEFRFAPDRRVRLAAVKGNYTAGQPLASGAGFESVWLQAAALPGTRDDLAAAYRDFALRHFSPNAASRRPYIFYNTWAFQERNKWWHGAKYLDSMRQDRILAEIDVAHRMGIDVFVLDTGWYGKTGDWEVNRERFPDGLRAVRERLAAYGMKLGLWFSPTQAAVSSRAVRDFPDCRMAWDGRVHGPFEVWETEASYNMCLVSRYWEAFADELIRLTRELGVTYFKWDAVGQYGCNAPDHDHGGADASPQQRADRYAFELGRAMVRIVDRLCAACPEAIVDFDITEGGRYVGLGFLAAGKYFLINNGPYFPSLDIPYDWRTATTWSNVFVHPGPARARVCRAPLDYDRWLPSVLFLTHYLPDDPDSSQLINLASLVLGQNGIWGDLLGVSPAGIALFGQVLGLYKQVRDDITRAAPVRTGSVGGSPEIHEKIAADSGRGVVAVFAGAPGHYHYVTQRRTAPGCPWTTPGARVTRTAGGQALLDLHFERPGAHLVFFGAAESAAAP